MRLTAAIALGLHAHPATAAVYRAIDLTPPGLPGALASAAGGGKQLGTDSLGRPVLWSGSAATAVVFIPAGHGSASLSAADATSQGGSVDGRAAI